MGSAVKVRRLKVNSKRNSVCGSAKMSELDWSNWWSEGSVLNGLYLNVKHKDGETVHRVFCLASRYPRLRLIDGELYWLV